MHLTRLALLPVAGFCLGLGQMLHAQTPAPAAPPPWTPDKQFSSDEVVSLKNGMTVTGKAYMDNGKIRTEMNMNGMDMVAIIRPDEKKIYTVMPAQKMVMEMPLDPAKMKQVTLLASDDAKYDFVGPDVVNGTPSLKYKMTTDGKIFYWWVNAATKAPIKIASEDGSFSTTFTNYKAGPQDASLFEPPAGFQVMQMPAGALPGGGAAAGQ
jgi:hypothetical protein